ncbi:ribose-phosphate diphosphokinase [Fibrella forsythiae]|uniref:Ribose-phosphate pyrophosphokinase n=1 Tax=Fibrella forsythiae TaxID=2817061 RepID=A0ABS3JEY7_9BACT|nr:ribose-phosphate diphosphokinase [Fibrella forsythiae]MBO0948562.1 ribose-phosphate pyrophosphokinase [Fibrella forsythiae]
MLALHLSPGFSPTDATPIAFTAFTFSGGEPHIKLDLPVAGNVPEPVLISQRVTTAADFMQLLLATDALRRAGYKQLLLMLPYFPAARQDRLMVPGEPLSVRVYADLINAQHYEQVYVYDPHSDVTPALLNNSQVIGNQTFVGEVLARFAPEKLCLVSPDAGALKKIHKLAAALGGVPVVVCDKERDVRTGTLTGFRVFADDLTGRQCLIVDDICDGGGTFVGLAAELRKLNPERVSLAVSHGIFSKGLAPLTNTLDHVYATDSFSTLPDTDTFTQLALKNLITL